MREGEKIAAPPDQTLDDLYEYAPCGYLTADTAGRVVRVNATLLQWLGLRREQVLGQPAQSILTQAGRVAFETHIAPHLREGASQRVALDLASADGGQVHVLSDWRAVFVDGAYVGVRAMLVESISSEQQLRDLNKTLEARTAERDRAHEQLRQGEKLEAIGHLTGGVAHDFNNLLSPIIGGLDTLQRRGFGDQRAQQVIANALEAAERAKTLVQRLLAFIRRQPLLPVAVDMAALLTGMIDLIRTTLGPRIELSLTVADGLPFAMADANQIEMALLNLAVNARDAMPDGGILTITASAEPLDPRMAGEGAATFIKLDITDTGSGMDEATMERAIEPFYSTKAPGKGTGMGLSMVHGLAAQLGGRLTLRSAPDAGTSVILHLPVAAGQHSHSPAEIFRRVEPENRQTILLVDDEPLVRASTAEMLSDLGYLVVEAESALSALTLLDDGLEPDALLTDNLMPGMTGCELAAEICARRIIPVLILSGHTEGEDEGLPFPRLGKPFRHRDLAAALDGLPRDDLMGDGLS